MSSHIWLKNRILQFRVIFNFLHGVTQSRAIDRFFAAAVTAAPPLTKSFDPISDFFWLEIREKKLIEKYLFYYISTRERKRDRDFFSDHGSGIRTKCSLRTISSYS